MAASGLGAGLGAGYAVGSARRSASADLLLAELSPVDRHRRPANGAMSMLLDSPRLAHLLIITSLPPLAAGFAPGARRTGVHRNRDYAYWVRGGADLLLTHAR